MSLNCQLRENNAGYTPIDYAIYYKLNDAAIAIVTHPRGQVQLNNLYHILYHFQCI